MLTESPTIRSEAKHRSLALSALLENLVDYAGLFPPAKLPMQVAVENYTSYLQGEFRWMLGRFIVPVTRLAEFETTISDLALAVHWPLSALIGADVAGDIQQVLAFNRRYNTRNLAISSVELKTTSPDEILSADSLIPHDLPAFFEIPLSADIKPCIATLANCKRFAKVRTGGETPEMIPPSAGVAHFISECVRAGVAFKATAGLHHPIRLMHALTYAADSPCATMHGFLNVFLAATLMRDGAITIAEATELLNETSVDAFTISDTELGWRAYRLDRGQIISSRQQFALSFGSCSFVEPVEDLRAFSLL